MKVEFFYPKQFASKSEQNMCERKFPYDTKDRTFLINGKEITVPWNINRHAVVNDTLLVLISEMGPDIRTGHKDFDSQSNIWAFNQNGEKLWEIEGAVESVVRQRIEKEGFPRERFYRDGVLHSGYDTYVGLNVGKQQYAGQTFVTTFGGFSGILNVQTGQVSNWIQGK